MARRPEIFDKDAFQESLRRLGCTESFVSPVTSDFRLIVPLALRSLGEEKLLSLLNESRDELKLADQAEFWKVVAKYASAWATEQIEEYKAQK